MKAVSTHDRVDLDIHLAANTAVFFLAELGELNGSLAAISNESLELHMSSMSISVPPSDGEPTRTVHGTVICDCEFCSRGSAPIRGAQYKCG